MHNQTQVDVGSGNGVVSTGNKQNIATTNVDQVVRWNSITSLRWRHNGRDGVSNHQSHECLLNHLFKSKHQSKHQRSASLAFVWGPVNSRHKWPVTRKMFPFDDVIMMGRWVSPCLVLKCVGVYDKLTSKFILRINFDTTTSEVFSSCVLKYQSHNAAGLSVKFQGNGNIWTPYCASPVFVSDPIFITMSADELTPSGAGPQQAKCWFKLYNFHDFFGRKSFPIRFSWLGDIAQTRASSEEANTPEA